MKVTRDVITDIWPVYEAGEASADTRALVDEFLAEDAEFAALLRSRLALPHVEAPMSPHSETIALKRTRDLVFGRGWLRGVRLAALALSALSLVHLFTSPSGRVEPRVIQDGIAALVAWTVYGVGIYVQRRWALRVRNR
jgi:hypothetical protein